MRIFLFLLFIALGAPAWAGTRSFTHFSAELPDGWDGEENSGFIKEGQGANYMLVFKIHDNAEENIRGVVSVFLLPPLPDSTEKIAEKMTAMQEDSTSPELEGNFWTFSGKLRTQGFKAPAVTRINSTADKVLIIIVQDPEQLGGTEIFNSLKGLTPEAREVLGR